MAAPKIQPATYADLEALPEHLVGQILFGVLHAHPRPTPRHAAAQGETFGELRSFFGRGGGGSASGWRLLLEPELHLGPHVVVPDIAGWRRERLPRLPDMAYIETPPDWVCEVLSPSTARIDRTDKLSIYAAFGVGHAWYIDPEARTLEVFALTSGAGAASAPEAQPRKWLLAATFKDADAVSAPPFEAHTFSLALLWPDEEAGPSSAS